MYKSNKKNRAYFTISSISVLIRQFLIPNPFEALGEGLPISIGEGTMVLNPLILNIIAEPFLFVVTFLVVRIFYKRKSNPPLGSFLYLIFYGVHVALIWLMSLMGMAIWAVILVLVIYIALLVALKIFIRGNKLCVK